MTNGANKAEAPLWKVLIVAFLPTFIYSIGQGSIVPVIPTVATSLGADLTFAAFIAGSLLIGQAIGNLPAGAIVPRIGERNAMIIAALATIIGALISVFAVNTWMLMAGVFVQGFMAATFALARQAFLSTYVPMRVRARAMSSLGGVFRSGMFIGPFIASWLIATTGDPQRNFWVFITCALLAVLVLLILPDIEKYARPNQQPDYPLDDDTGAIMLPQERQSVWSVMRERKGVLLWLGSAAGMMMMLRQSRNILLPVWGLSIGLDDAVTTLVIGVAAAIDFALFFTSGWIMDKFGRAASAVPAMTGMGIGFLVLSFTHDAASAVTWFIVVTLFIGLANGVGSGIVMTLGADLADQDNPAPFLAAWRTVTDGSSASVPFVITGVQLVAGLSVTVGIFGGLGLLGAGLFLRYIPRYLKRP